MFFEKLPWVDIFLERFFRKQLSLCLSWIGTWAQTFCDSHKLTMAFRLKNKKLSVGEALQFEKHKWLSHRMSLRREKAIVMAMALKLSCTRQELEAFEVWFNYIMDLKYPPIPWDRIPLAFHGDGVAF